MPADGATRSTSSLARFTSPRVSGEIRSSSSSMPSAKGASRPNACSTAYECTAGAPHTIRSVSAHEALVEELRRHALVIGEVTLTSGRTAQYYVDAKRAILRPRG